MAGARDSAVQRTNDVSDSFGEWLNAVSCQWSRDGQEEDSPMFSKKFSRSMQIRDAAVVFSDALASLVLHGGRQSSGTGRTAFPASSYQAMRARGEIPVSPTTLLYSLRSRCWKRLPTTSVLAYTAARQQTVTEEKVVAKHERTAEALGKHMGPCRAHHAAVALSGGQTIIFHGGKDEDGIPQSDLFALHVLDAAQLELPQSLVQHPSQEQPAENEGTAQIGLWETLNRDVGGCLPPSLYGHSMIASANSDVVLVVGVHEIRRNRKHVSARKRRRLQELDPMPFGQKEGVCVYALTVSSLVGRSWARLPCSSNVPPRRYFGLALDAMSQTVWLFGGLHNSCWLCDLWSLSLGTSLASVSSSHGGFVWQRVHYSSGPPPVLHPVHQAVIYACHEHGDGKVDIPPQRPIALYAFPACEGTTDGTAKQGDEKGKGATFEHPLLVGFADYRSVYWVQRSASDSIVRVLREPLTRGCPRGALCMAQIPVVPYALHILRVTESTREVCDDAARMRAVQNGTVVLAGVNTSTAVFRAACLLPSLPHPTPARTEDATLNTPLRDNAVPEAVAAQTHSLALPEVVLAQSPLPHYGNANTVDAVTPRSVASTEGALSVAELDDLLL